jgi:hypothetical protein
MRRRLEAAELVVVVVVAIDSLSGWQSKKKHKHHYRPSTFFDCLLSKSFWFIFILPSIFPEYLSHLAVALGTIKEMIFYTYKKARNLKRDSYFIFIVALKKLLGTMNIA